MKAFHIIGAYTGLMLLALSPFHLIAQTLTVGVETTEYYPQYTFKNDQYGGYARDLLDLFGVTYGYDIRYKAYPIKRLLNKYLAGKIDLKYPDNRLWAKKRKSKVIVTYSDPVVNYIDGVLVKPSDKGKGLTYLKLLGTLRGFFATEYSQEIHSGQLRISENGSITALIKQAYMGRVDGIYFNVSVAHYHLALSHHKHALQFDKSLPHTKAFYSLSSIHRPDVITQFNLFLKSHNKAITALKQKYKVEEGLN